MVIGLASFFVTYVSYRNLKNYLPRLAGDLQDPALHRIDQFLAFGHEPAVLLHTVLGEGAAAHVLAFVYLLFLPLTPASLIVATDSSLERKRHKSVTSSREPSPHRAMALICSVCRARVKKISLGSTSSATNCDGVETPGAPASIQRLSSRCSQPPGL